MVMIWAAAAVVFLSPQYVGISVMALTTVLSFQLFLHIRLKSQAGITFLVVYASLRRLMRACAVVLGPLRLLFNLACACVAATGTVLIRMRAG
jgi:hypothetical protein